jgi:hypothetical protein
VAPGLHTHTERLARQPNVTVLPISKAMAAAAEEAAASQLLLVRQRGDHEKASDVSNDEDPSEPSKAKPAPAPAPGVVYVAAMRDAWALVSHSAEAEGEARASRWWVVKTAKETR